MCLGTLAEAGVVKDAELAVQILWCVLPVNGHLALGRAIRQLEGPFQKFNPKEGGKNNSKILPIHVWYSVTCCHVLRA